MAFSALESLTKKKDTGGTTNASGNSIGTNSQPAFSALNSLAQNGTPQRPRYSFVPAERHPVTIANNVINGYGRAANLALRNGTYNAKTYNNQYAQIKKSLDDLEKDGRYSSTGAIKALRTKLDGIYESLNPKKIEIQGYTRTIPGEEHTRAFDGATVRNYQIEQGKPFRVDQSLLTAPATPQSYENDRMYFNKAGSVPNTALARLNQLANQKIQNDAMLRNTAYYQSIGAPMDNYSSRDLQTLQNLYGNLSAQQEAMQIRRAESKPLSPYEGVRMPGKDDLEDYSTKFDRIKKEHPAWSDDQVDDFIQNGEREDYTVAAQSPLANQEIFSRANNNIQTELGRREFWSQYAPLFQEKDFKEMSKPAYTIPAEYIPDYRDEQARNEMSEDDLEGLLIAAINGNEQAREFLHYRSSANGEKTQYSNRYDRFGTDKEIYMSADDVDMFNYILNKKGKKAAMKFYDGLSDALDARKSAAIDEEWRQLTREAPFFANVATTLLKPATTVGSGLEQLYQLVTTGNINPDDPSFHYTGGVNTVRGTSADIIREGTGSDFLADLYNTGMSVIDNVYDLALGTGVTRGLLGITGSAANKITEAFTLGIMSTDAAQNATLENLRNGQDTTSALINGAASGIIEFLTEKIGLDNLFSSRWMNKSKWISTMISQMGAEGGEEGLSKIMNWAWGAAYDKLTGQTTSDWTRDINAYILENGLAPNDQQKAFEHVFSQKMGELGEDIMGGAMSGFMMGGPGTFRGTVELNNQVRNIMPASISFSSTDSSAPANVRLADVDQVQGLIEEGLSYEPTTKAYKKAAKLQTMLDTGTVTDSQAIDLYKELVKADVTNESHATPELSSIDRSGETRPQTAFPMQGPSVNVPAATAQKFIPQDLYLAALQNATEQDNTTTGSTGIDAGEAEALISDIFNAGLEGEMTEDVASRARAFLDKGYTDAIYQAGVQARDTNRQTAFGPTFNMPAQEMVQRDQLIEDVAAGYDSAGRTSMGEVMRAFNPFKNHAVTDMSTADYVSEISAVYNAAAQNQEIPPAPHLTPEAAQAAINAAKMDRIYLDEGITSAEQAEMEAPEETNAAVRPAEYTPVEKTAEQRDTDYESVLDYAGEVATVDGQETFGDVVANNYYDDMDANAYTDGAQTILEQAQQGVPLEDVTLPAQAQKFISPQLKAELYNAVNTQEALGNAVNTQEVINGTEESGNVPVLGSSGRVNSTDTGIQSETVAGRTGQTETAGSTANVRSNVRTAFHPTGQTATARSLGIDTGTDVNEVQIVELDDTEENNQLREIATAAHKKLVTFVGNNLSTTGQPARGVITGDTIYVRADHPTLSPLQIGKHEVMHGELRGDTNHKINTILNHLRKLTDASFVDNILIPAYRKRYAASGLSDLRVLEEMLCDIYGEMNEWNWKDLPGMEQAFNTFLSRGAQIVHETARNLNQTAEAVTEVRNNGPPTETRFSSNQENFDELYTTLPDGRIKPNNIDDLSTEDWKLIYKAVNKLGYGMKSVKETKTVYSRYVAESGFNKEQSDAIKEAYGVTESIKVSPNPKREALAVKTFGTTTDFREAGYLMRNGKMLDFSGKRDGGPAHVRYMDHREVSEVFEDDELPAEKTKYGSITPYMNAFISEGNVRLMESQGVTIGEMEPTQQQYGMLRKFVEHVLDNEGYFYLDLSDNDGRTVASRDYATSDGADRIIRDIKGYFKNGELPYMSSLSQFRFSTEAESAALMDADYMAAVNAGDMETAQRMVDDAAMRIPTIATEQRGRLIRPKHLYHGTRFFGFTQFKDSNYDVPFIYTSSDRTVSAHYAGDNHYAGVRNIGKKYDGGNSIDAIIKDAKTVWGRTYHVATEAEKAQAFKNVRDEAIKIADRIDELHTDLGLSWDNDDDVHISNQIAWVENLFWVMRDSDFTTLAELQSEETGYTPENVMDDIRAFENAIGDVKKYYSDNYSKFTPEQKKYVGFLQGYDVGDAAIDIQYKIGKILENDTLLADRDGYFAVPEAIRESLDQVHNIGAYDLYGDLGSNPFEFDADGAQFWAVKVPQMGDDYYSTDQICKWAYEHGYSSVIMRNIYDYGDKADNYVFFDTSQLKSADPVTYDDAGNVIPLSERFNTENPDIRYSKEIEGQTSLTSKSQEDVAADLKKRVTQLEKKAEYFKGQTKLSALTPGSAAWKNMKPLINEYGARKILRSVQDFYGSTADIKGMVPEIQRLVTLLATRPDANTFDDVNHLILPIAKQLIENTQVIVEDDGSEILKDIRRTTIKVNPRVQHDIADYNKWRMSHFGKMNLSTNKGTDVTEYYKELTERFGEAAFPSDIGTATDQLLYIADFVDNYQPVTQNPYSYDMAALTQDAALTLYNEMLNADLFKPTYADRQNARIEKLQQESTERVQEVRRQARQQRDDQIQKIKDHAKDVAARRRARKEEQTARQKLIRLARRLNGMKTTKANRALIEELIGNLDTVAYSLTEGKAANLMELNAWYETQKETNPDFVAHADLVQKQLARLTQQHIADMTVSEILDLTKSLMTLENDIRTQNKLINSKMNEDALQAGIKAIRDIDNARGIDKGLRRTIDNLIVQGTLSPTRFMHRLTGYNDSDPLYQAVAGEDGLAGGQRKMLDYQYRAGKLFEEWLSDRKFTRWFTGTKAEILSYDIVTADGQQRTIQMTPAMRTTLYLAAKDKGWMQHMCGRDTMDGHIAGGGIVLPDIKSYRKGNIADAYDSGTVKVKITKSFLDKLAQDMTEQELGFANAIHDYFNGMSKDEINATSELLLGRSIAEVGDYLPISVDKNFLGAEYGSIKYDGTIEGMGNLKERQASKKPVIVRDITDILKQSIESTSKYVGLAIPIRNFNKIMGVTVGHTDENGVYQNFEGSVLESIANKWGKKAQTYIENMVSDLQTPNNSQEDLEKMFAKIRSKYAGAVLTLNASVALKQAASYPTAAAVLGWKPLMQAFQNPGHVDLDFIAKWTPLQWYRTKGFSTTELGDIQNQNNFFANMPKGLNWIQGMDLITTRKLWKAAEYYVRDNNPELYQKGAGERGQSDAFYRAVADIYNKTIEETQPNYTALQRPEYLRSKSGLVRTLMMFKTQPMQNFNVIYDAVGDFQAKRAQYRNNADSAEAQQAYEESGKRLRRAVTSQIGQLITFAAMTMLWNMFRRKKEKYTDEEGNVSLEKIAESMGKDIGSGVFGMVPFGSEVWSFISSKIFGDKYYGFESVTDSAISDFLNAGSSAWELIGKIIEDDEPFNITTYKKKLKTVLSSASKIMGVPFDNLYNTVTAGYMRGRDLVDGLFHGNKNLADYWALSWTEDASKDKAELFDILYNAHMDGKEGEYEEILDLMINSGEYGDKPEETIADGLQDAFIKHTTHTKGEPDSDAKYRLYDYMYKHQEDADYEKLHEDALFFGFTEDDIEKGIRNSLAAELIGVPSNEFNKDGLYGHLYSIFDTAEYKEKHDTLTANGWTEDEITDGLKKAYGVQLTGIDSSDYKNADLFTYLYDMKQTNSAGYTAATKEMKKIGYTDDNITDGMKKAYGMQVTGVTEEYSTAVLFDYLYDLKKNHVSNYNAELTKMKGVGFTDKNINDGMKDAYGRAVTGLGSDYTSEALYTTVYKNNKSSLSGKVSEMKGFGFSEQSIRDGLKQAYGSSATGIAYQTVKMDDVYDYIYGLYSQNSNRFGTEYQAMLNVGFTEKAIKDGIEARMKAAYGVDNVKKLPHRFAAPDHTLPSYWTYKNDDKDTGPVKESGTVTGSSHVGGYEYDNGELTIYMNGRPYTYHGVPESVFEDFKAAGSKGGFVNDHIKGKYSYN